MAPRVNPPLWKNHPFFGLAGQKYFVIKDYEEASQILSNLRGCDPKESMQ
jgi:hypothetical protein